MFMLRSSVLDCSSRLPEGVAVVVVEVVVTAEGSALQ